MVRPEREYPIADPGLMDYLRVVRRWWWLLVLGGVLGAAGTVGYFLWRPPVYRAEAVMAPVSEGKGNTLSVLAEQFGGLASGLAGGEGGLHDPRQQLAILQSRAFTVGIVEDNNLLTELFPERWSPRSGGWIGEPPTLWDAYRKMSRIREVHQDRRSGLVTVAIRWDDPDAAARWVDLHVRGLNRTLQRRAIEASEKSISFLTEQVSRTSNVEMRQTLFRLIEVEAKKGVLARATDEFAFAVIDPAVPPDRDERPAWVTLLFLGGGGGGAAALFGVFLIEYLGAERARRQAAGAGAA